MTETAVGNVFGYNFAVDNFYTEMVVLLTATGDAYGHDDGDYYNLWEVIRNHVRATTTFTVLMR